MLIFTYCDQIWPVIKWLHLAASVHEWFVCYFNTFLKKKRLRGHGYNSCHRKCTIYKTIFWFWPLNKTLKHPNTKAQTRRRWKLEKHPVLQNVGNMKNTPSFNQQHKPYNNIKVPEMRQLCCMCTNI